MKYWSLVALIVFAPMLIAAELAFQLSRSPLPEGAVAQLTISSRSTIGTPFQPSVTGRYIFEYATGGFLAYQPSPVYGCDRSSFKCYSTRVVGYRGASPRWVRQDLNYDSALFALGEVNNGWTLAEAEAQVQGTQTTVRLKAGEAITVVVGDLRSAYYDNTGAITLNVYFDPGI